MSIFYSIEINIAQRTNNNISLCDIVKCLLEYGWSLYSEKNKVIYTDIGDNDDFDFLADNLSETEFFEIISVKEKIKENVSFALFWAEENSLYRIDVIINSDFGILVSPDDGTKRILIPDFKILDVNWYLSRVLPPLLMNNRIIVENFSFSQI